MLPVLPEVDRLKCLHRLWVLLRAATVQVIAGSSRGSGFFVAPGFVVTCSHLVGGRDAPVLILWDGRKLSATVRYASVGRGGDRSGYPDLAIVELDRQEPGQPCVWLDFRRVLNETPLQIIGFADEVEPTFTEKTLNVRYAASRRFGDGEMLEFHEGEVRRGMSGGPVLNTITGGVCGLQKAAREPGKPTGGLATSIRALRTCDSDLYRRVVRAHDIYHAPGNAWTEAVDALVGLSVDELIAAEERALRGHLAALTVTSRHDVAFQRAASQLHRPADDLLDYGDVVTDLGELPRPVGLPYVLAYACDLAADQPAGLRTALRDWVLATAARLGMSREASDRLDRSRKAVAGSRQPPVSVMIQVRPAGTGGLVELSIWQYIDANNVVLSFGGDETSLPLEEVWERLQEVLAGEISALGEYDAEVMVEFFLPQHLLDTNLDEWRVWPEDWAALGRRHSVVVRDGGRLEDRRVGFSWKRRWDSLDEVDVGSALEYVTCSDGRTHEQIEGWIEAAEARSAFVFSSSPLRSGSRAVLEVGLPAGVPVLIWRRRACPATAIDGCEDCGGRSFFEAVRGFLRGGSVSQLPSRVRMLRAEAASAADRSHYGHGIVLLWDDPRRRPPRDRLTLPKELQTGG